MFSSLDARVTLLSNFFFLISIIAKLTSVENFMQEVVLLTKGEGHPGGIAARGFDSKLGSVQEH